MRILIVEDSVSMRRVMKMTFAGEDAELLAVESGELALQQGRDFGPDVAFVDTSLPGIDGYEVARAIKSDPQLAGTGVILMASQHRPLDAARASEVGADDHILKPFDTQEAIDKAGALAGGGPEVSIEMFDEPEPASIPVARPATTPPRPVSPSYRPTPPPLPVASQAPMPAARPISSAPRVSATPITGAQVSVSPASAPSLHAPAPPAAVVSRAPSTASLPTSPPPAAGVSESPLHPAGASEELSTSVVARLETLGLTPDQVEAVLKLSAEVVERVVWEVVPELAESMIREELHRLIGD